MYIDSTLRRGRGSKVKIPNTTVVLFIPTVWKKKEIFMQNWFWTKTIFSFCCNTNLNNQRYMKCSPNVNNFDTYSIFKILTQKVLTQKLKTIHKLYKI